VGEEDDLAAAAPAGLGFDRVEQAGAEPPAALRFVDPQVLQLAAPTPGPAVGARQDRPVGVPDEDRELALGLPLAPGALRVVPRDPGVEDRDVVGVRVVLDREPGRAGRAVSVRRDYASMSSCSSSAASSK
jgi:hypothetical protein